MFKLLFEMLTAGLLVKDAESAGSLATLAEAALKMTWFFVSFEFASSITVLEVWTFTFGLGLVVGLVDCSFLKLSLLAVLALDWLKSVFKGFCNSQSL